MHCRMRTEEEHNMCIARWEVEKNKYVYCKMRTEAKCVYCKVSTPERHNVCIARGELKKSKVCVLQGEISRMARCVHCKVRRKAKCV